MALSYFIVFLCGYWAQSTGSLYLDAVVSYVKLHTTQRWAAWNIQALAQSNGIPLVLTSEAETYKIYAVAGSCAAWLLHKVGWAQGQRGPRALAAVLATYQHFRIHD